MEHAFCFFVGEDEGDVIDGVMFTELCSRDHVRPNLSYPSRIALSLLHTYECLRSCWFGRGDQSEMGGGKGRQSEPMAIYVER